MTEHAMQQQDDSGLARDFPLLVRRRLMGLTDSTTLDTLAAVTDEATRPTEASPTEASPTEASPTEAHPTEAHPTEAHSAEAHRGGGSALLTRTAVRTDLSRANPLTRSGIVRGDIRRGFGTARRVAEGVPLTVRLRLVSANSGQPGGGYAIYLWHGDRDGSYSLHSAGLTQENYLRGVQASDDTGWVTFRSIFPGAHAGQWPHLHFEVFASITAASTAGGTLHRSRLALPGDVCDQVYATAGYAESRKNLCRSSLTANRTLPLEMASVSGDVRRGFVASRTVRL